MTFVIAAAILSGCAPRSDKGEVFVTGSSTVEPIAVFVGEQFMDETGADVSVEGPGTGDGFKKFCAGDADIVDASRLIKDEEKAACGKAGVEFEQFAIARDAITVMTSAKNSAVTCLTFGDLYGLVGPESEGVAKWSDAAAKGATSDLPDADLKVFAPGTESGTYDSFWELAIKKQAEGKLGKDKAAEQKLRPDYGGLANDNEIVDSIASNDTSFGWVGFAYAEKATGVKEVEIDGGSGCVSPSADTVKDGTYPLSRTLYFYVNKASLRDATVADFVKFYKDSASDAAEQVGYIRL